VLIFLDFSAILWYNKVMMTDENTLIIESLQKQIKDLSEQVRLLTEQNLMLRNQLFGRKSESHVVSVPDNQLSLFNEAECESDASIPEPVMKEVAYKRKKRTGKREQDFAGLPVEQVIHELPEAGRICPDCGGALHECAHDLLRRELTIVPAQYKVTEHIQTVYACRSCEENADASTMIKAEVPAPVVKGSGIASPSLAAHIAHQKYTLALPLYRQEQEFKRNNLNISRQTMANWLVYVTEHWLAPIYIMLRVLLCQAQVTHADETVVQVLHESGKTAESKSYMWLYRTSGDTNRHIVLYDYQPNRKYENPKIFLEGFKGFLHSDGYEAYHNLPDDITVSGCWAHVRRKFTDLLKSLPDYNKEGSIPMRGIEFCDKLFRLEREYAKLSGENNFKARYEARLKRSKPVMDEFFAWAKESTGSIFATPRSATGKALAYALNERQYLENVLLDGRLELSNNRAERSVKPFVIGRKNWLFSNTEKGADTSAVLYSIIETSKENGIKPYEYLKFIFETAPNLDLTRKPDLVEVLLPWNAPSACRAEKQLSVGHVELWDEI
jgi:transposase